MDPSGRQTRAVASDGERPPAGRDHLFRGVLAPAVPEDDVAFASWPMEMRETNRVAANPFGGPVRSLSVIGARACRWFGAGRADDHLGSDYTPTG